MTTEEKARAYDEALERAKARYDKEPTDGYVGYANQILEELFPTLAESEDERIRKELIECIDSLLKAPGASPRLCDWLAWLEKQKEYVSDNFDDVWTAEVCEELIEAGEKLSPRLKELLKELCHAWYDKGIELGKKHKVNTEGDFGIGYDCGYQAGYSVAMHEMKPKFATATLDSEKQKEQKELPLMNGDSDAYFDEWNLQQQNPTIRQCFEEGIRYAQRLQKEQKPTLNWRTIEQATTKRTDEGDCVTTERMLIKGLIDNEDYRIIDKDVMVNKNLLCIPVSELNVKEQKPIQSDAEREYVRTLKSLISDFLRGKDHIDIGYYQKIYDWLDGRTQLDDIFKEGRGHYFFDGVQAHFCSAPAMEERELDDPNEPVEHWQYMGEVNLEEDKEEQGPMDMSFEDWLDGWYQEHEEDGEIIMNAAEFKNWSRGIRNMYQQKPNIELIQRSWYMEGYHDRDFNKEPKWVIKTGEGGPRYEENPKYGQLIEKKSSEWSEEDEKVYTFVYNFFEDCWWNTAWDISREQALKMLKSLKPQFKQEWSEEDKETYDILLNFFKQCADGRQTSLKHGEQYRIYNFLKTFAPRPHWKPSDVCYGIKGDPDDAGVWKPSEEQMKALEKAIIKAHSTDEIPILTELRQQLKKLM